MKYDHNVIHKGVLYPAGAEVPVEETPVEKKKTTVKRRTATKKTTVK